MRITKAMADAFEAGDRAELRRLLNLKPWQVSPLDEAGRVPASVQYGRCALVATRASTARRTAEGGAKATISQCPPPKADMCSATKDVR